MQNNTWMGVDGITQAEVEGVYDGQEGNHGKRPEGPALCIVHHSGSKKKHTLAGSVCI
jgi:hypothetical protein